MTAGTEPSGTPWAGLTTHAAEAADAPPVEANRTVRHDAAPLEGAAEEPVAATPKAKRTSRTALLGGLVLSLALHGAALAFFFDQLRRSGLEAEAEQAVSIEIVLDAAPVPSVAGTGSGVAEPVPGDARAVPGDSPEGQEDASEETAEPDTDSPAQEETAAIGEAPDEPPADPAFVPPPPDAALAEMLAAPPEIETEQAPAPEPEITVPPPSPARMQALAAPPTVTPETVAEAAEPEVALPAAEDVPLPSPRPEARRSQTAEASARPEKAKPRKPARDGKAKAGEQRPAQAAKTGDGKQKEKPKRKQVAAGSAAGAPGGASAGAEARYARTLNSHIQRHKRYPEAAQRQRLTGVTKLSITIDRSGRLAAARVAAGSGHRMLDEEALAVARRAAPYPPPPEGVGKSTFAFMVSLRFKP